jgi:hypothetical protein
VSAATGTLPVITRETVAGDTPAIRAMSTIVGALFLGGGDFGISQRL